MEQALARIDMEIRKHMVKKDKLVRLHDRVGKMIGYRERRIRELGIEWSRAANFTLEL